MSDHDATKDPIDEEEDLADDKSAKLNDAAILDAFDLDDAGDLEEDVLGDEDEEGFGFDDIEEAA